MSSDALANTATAEASPTFADGDAAKAPKPRKNIAHYRLDNELGAGGMGIVYAAFDPELERRVAIKLLLRQGSTETQQRFLREARALAKLTHPNVVHVYEVGSHEGRDFISMELVDGSSVDVWLRSQWRSMRDIVAVFLAAGRGLAAAHSAGIVHRDFKPHNILRGKDGRVLVTDFGLATAAEPSETAVDGDDAVSVTTLTATGSWVGTPAYMAPEQWNGGIVGPATDQFAFCVALWEALTNERPFRGETTNELRDDVLRGLAKLRTRNVPRRYRAALVRGLDPDPTKRWPSMEVLLQELERRSKTSQRILIWSMIIFGGGPILAGGIYGHLEGRAARDREKHEMAAEIRPDDAGTAEVTRPAMRVLISEVQAGANTRFVPAFANGKALGFRIEQLESSAFLAAIGLQNGDMVTAIDGTSLMTSSDDFAVAIKRLSPEAASLRFDLIRNDMPRTIEVRVTK